MVDWLKSPMSRWLARRRLHEQQRLLAPRPAVGSTLVCSGLRMGVQAGMSDDLWRWLQAHGWHTMPARANRMRFRPLPTRLVARLIDCAPEQREALLVRAIREATTGPDPATARSPLKPVDRDDEA